MCVRPVTTPTPSTAGRAEGSLKPPNALKSGEIVYQRISSMVCISWFTLKKEPVDTVKNWNIKLYIETWLKCSTGLLIIACHLKCFPSMNVAALLSSSDV